MAIFGQNGLWAAALYFGTIFALYGTKRVNFEDSKEIDQLPVIRARKAKQDPAEYRQQMLGQQFKKELTEEFKKSYGEKKYIR